MNIYRFFFFNFILSVAISVTANAYSLCDAKLLPTPERVLEVRTQLEQQISQVDATLKGMEISGAHLGFIKELGTGAQGVVMIVEDNGHFYALKLYRAGRRENFRESIIIQRHLNELGLAAKVFGILDKTEIDGFLKPNRQYLSPYNRSDTYQIGVLMEITPNKFLKDRFLWNAVQVTPEQKRLLQSQARAYMAILDQLRVEPHDIDAVVDRTGNLLLADFGSYRMATPEEEVDLGLVWLAGKQTDPVDNLLQKISLGTSTLKARWQKLKAIFGAAN